MNLRSVLLLLNKQIRTVTHADQVSGFGFLSDLMMFIYDTGPLIIHNYPSLSNWDFFFPPQREGVVPSRAVLLIANVAVAAQECHLVTAGGSGAVNN